MWESQPQRGQLPIGGQEAVTKESSLEAAKGQVPEVCRDLQRSLECSTTMEGLATGPLKEK